MTGSHTIGDVTVTWRAKIDGDEGKRRVTIDLSNGGSRCWRTESIDLGAVKALAEKMIETSLS